MPLYQDYTNTYTAGPPIQTFDLETAANNIEPLRTDTTTAVTWDYLTRDYNNGWRVAIDYVTKKDLEEFARKIYKIIEEHTSIDISEDEFMKLLED